MSKIVGWGVAVLLAAPGLCFAQPAQSPGQLKRVVTGLKNGPAWFRQGAGWLLQREYVDHMMFVATDARGGTSGGGFYRPTVSRYDWDWLRQRFDRDGDGAITLAEFAGPREWFETLDKDRDGVLTKDDFAWFGDTALAKASAKVKSLYYQIDRDGNGQVTFDEWKAWFDSLSGGRGYVGQDDLLPLFMDKKGPGGKGAAKGPQRKSRLPVVCSYISGDVGSPSEGPALGEMAPDFTLSTGDGKDKITLSRHRGQKPLVLIFGSFT
jgi:hypothetical protein